MLFAEFSIPDNFWVGLAGSAVFGLVGLVLLLVGLLVGYKMFDKIIPEINFGEELKKGNMSVAVVVAVTMAALVLGIAYIVANVIH